MCKRISLFLGLCLILGLFTACAPTPSEELMALIEKVSALEEDHTFLAEGTLSFPARFEGDPVRTPAQYVMEGRRSVRTGQLAAEIQYTDISNAHQYGVSLLTAGGGTYVSFVPLFQYIFDHEYSDPYVLADAFPYDPYLALSTLDLSDLLVDIPALLQGLSRLDVDEYLTVSGGMYAFSLTGEQAGRDALVRMVRPFALASDLALLPGKEVESENDSEYEADNEIDPLEGEDAEIPETFLDTLFTGPLTRYRLDFTLADNEEAGTLTVWLTLITPTGITITSDVTYYKHTAVPPILPPNDPLEIAEMQALLSYYRAAQARARFLADSGLVIIPDLPELHMVDHQLSSSALIYHEMSIGDATHNVSILAAGDNTENAFTGAIFSFAPAMSFLYTSLDAFYASETMALFALRYLDIEHFDGENHKYTPMRINAHDTAAVMALVFDDNVLDRSIYIYVLQAIAGTDKALFLSIIIFPDMISNAERDALADLGFYIGLDFLEYLALVPIEETGDGNGDAEEEEENEEDDA